MLHVVEEKRLNDFKEFRCIKPRDLYFRMGRRVPDTSFQSNLEQSVPMNMNKLDSIEYLERYDAMMQERQSTNNDSSSESHVVKRNEVSEES